MQTRNSTTNKIDPDPAKFPNGIDGLANEIHKLGLKIGIYRCLISNAISKFYVHIAYLGCIILLPSDAGTQTCAGYPGSLGNESIDAVTFADWGIDCMYDLTPSELP